MSEPSQIAKDAAADLDGGEIYAGIIQSAIDQATAEKDREIERLRELADIGERWRADSSLEKWFPLSAERITDLEAQITELKIERNLLAKTDTTKLPEWIAGYEAIQAENLQYKERNYDLRMEVERLRGWPAKQAIQIQELMQANWDATRKCSQLSVKVEALEKLLGELRHVGG